MNERNEERAKENSAPVNFNFFIFFLIFFLLRFHLSKLLAVK